LMMMKLNMVYLAELSVVMTDRLKIVRIHARNMHRIHGHKRLDDNAFLASVFCSSVSRADAPKCRPVETLKNHLRATCACLAVATEQESCRNNVLFT